MSLVKRNQQGFPIFKSWMDDFWGTTKFFDDDLTKGSVNIKETDKNYEIEVVAPGMKKDDFKVKVQNGVLSISAERKNEEEKKDANYIRREYNFQSFSRSFTVPQNVSEDNISAKYEDGLLKLTLTKTEASGPKSKEVQIS